MDLLQASEGRQLQAGAPGLGEKEGAVLHASDQQVQIEGKKGSAAEKT